MTWIVELLNDVVEAELLLLPRDMLARFQRIVELIEGQGLKHVHEPHIKHLEGKLWEIRLKGREWYITCNLCNREWQASGSATCVYQKNAQDAT